MLKNSPELSDRGKRSREAAPIVAKCSLDLRAGSSTPVAPPSFTRRVSNNRPGPAVEPRISLDVPCINVGEVPVCPPFSTKRAAIMGSRLKRT